MLNTEGPSQSLWESPHARGRAMDVLLESISLVPGDFKGGRVSISCLYWSCVCLDLYCELKLVKLLSAAAFATAVGARTVPTVLG